jgi:2-polyprenyl-6-methoxyphenol hydroxylase-like FAD-dependent oxidoreductase
MPFVGRTAADDRLGHTAWVWPISLAAMNWGDLWRNLRKRVPDSIYHQGRAVTDAKSVDGGRRAVVQLDDGSQRSFDLVIFADGYRSLGRRLLCLEVDLQYCGYALWRGVLDEKDLDDSDPLEGLMPRLSYKGLAGHIILYFVPGHNGSTAKGKRWVNWAAYIPVLAEELPGFLTDRQGRQHSGSLPPGAMRPEEEDRLKQLMQAHLPTYYADIVNASQDTFAQPIFLVEMPGYHQGRICLIGDAGAVAQPFTGSGVFKGANNAIDLAAALQAHRDVDVALHEWDKKETTTGRRLVVLGRQMEQAFIWSAPDFSQMDAQTTAAWFKNAVTFPEEFTYSATED